MTRLSADLHFGSSISIASAFVYDKQTHVLTACYQNMVGIRLIVDRWCLK